MTEIQTDSQTQTTTTTEAQQPEGVQNSFSIPNEYANKGWTEKIRSQDDLWKTLDNAQTLIGKRPAGIPSNDAPDAEWDSFYKAMGRPDQPSYEFNDPENIPENFDTASYKEKAAKILHEAGLTQKQAEKVYSRFIEGEIGSIEELKKQHENKQADLNKQYDSLINEHFESPEKYDIAAKNMQDAVNRYTPQSLKEAYGELQDNPKALAAVVSTINGMNQEIARIKSQYGVEDKITTGQQTSSQSIDDVRSELAKLRTSPEYRDFTNPAYNATKTRIDELSGIVSRHYSSKK